VDKKARLYLGLILTVGLGVPFLFCAPAIVRQMMHHSANSSSAGLSTSSTNSSSATAPR
jgi:hypothetical protein